MKKLLTLPFVIFFAANSFAQENESYPNISGQALVQLRADRIASTKAQGVSPNNIWANARAITDLNLNKNWAIEGNFVLYPTYQRDYSKPERLYFATNSNRGFQLDNEGLVIEELKAKFENDEMKFFAGKFNPSFGTMYRENKSIGVFNAYFTKDYQLREKIGAGVTAILDDSEVTANTFFNDTTGLSGSAINDRGRARRADGIAGNTSTFSSYSVTMEGGNLFNHEKWFYNVGYRSLGTEKVDNAVRETGYVVGSEYAFEFGSHGAIIPLFELVRINDFGGFKGRNATYKNFAVIGKYNSWSLSVSSLTRNIRNSPTTPKINDQQLQFNTGYKFTNNLSLDVSYANLKEDNRSSKLVGAMLSYLFKF